MDSDIVPIKPCTKCGATDRAKSGYCKPCASVRRREQYLKNKEANLKQSKEWVEKNRERSREIKRKWAEANSEKLAKVIKNWQLANPARMSKNRKNWNEVNKEYKRILTTNRRRKLANGKLSKNIVEVLMNKQNGLCACCGVPLNGTYHIDHILPIALGGPNTDDNVQLLLPKCNLEKGASHPEVFKKRRMNLHHG